jgi:predicted extracellular nuclease
MPSRPFTVSVFLCLVAAVLMWPAPASAQSTELFFSEYVEGSSNNKALEIFNGGSAAGLTINLTGTVAAGDVSVLAHALANAAILSQADQTNSMGWFNGDDAVVLRKGTAVIDVIGQIGFDPGNEWGAGVTSTQDNTLRRKAAISAGDTNGGDAFDPAVEWSGFAQDTFEGLGSHNAEPPVLTATIWEIQGSGLSSTHAGTTRRTRPSTTTTWWTRPCGPRTTTAPCCS